MSSHQRENAVFESHRSWNMDSSLCSSSTLTPDGGETGVVLPHMLLHRLTFYRIILRSTEVHAEK